MAQKKKVDENKQVNKTVKKAAKKATKKALKNKNVQIALIVIVVAIIIALVVIYFVKPEIITSIISMLTGESSSSGSNSEKNNGTGHVIDGSSVVINVIDVGQGDGIYIEFPTGENMFIDGGSEFGTTSRLDNIKAVFTANNVTKLDYYMLTHLDYDHIRYTKNICDLLEIETFYIPYVFEEYLDNSDWYSSTWNTAYTAIKAETYTENGEAKASTINRNLGAFDLGGDTWVMHCYTYTQEDYPKQNTSINKNAISPVCFLQYGGRTTCLTGDQNFTGEEYLYNKGYFSGYDIDVLKVAHHGSHEGTHKDYFLDVVDPEYAIISVGADNSYEHPRQDLLDRLTNYTDVTPDTDANGIQKLYRTDQDGNVTITMTSEGTINIECQNDTTKNVTAVACIMYEENNNIEIVYVAYIKKEGEE